MNIEEEIFKKSKINYNKLISYGFKKEKGKYTISKNILNNSFRIDIEVSNNKVKGRIIDLSFNEEYINYKVETQTGEFVSKVREEFKSFLLDIKEKCTTTNYFLTSQANRLIKKVIKKYDTPPEFLWKKSPEYGVIRHKSNNKWYGIIMNIEKNKINKNSKNVKIIEILNIKLDKKEIKKLLNKKGFYKAYHMNKENWITIILDETLKDEDIMNYIDKSYKITK